MAQLNSKTGRLGNPAIAIGCGADSGRAFPIGDALLALRWSSLVQPLGYRLTFSHDFRNADEVLEIGLPPHPMPIARIHRGAHVVWVTDCAGRSRVFVTLADALLSVAGLSQMDRRVMLKARVPPWLEPCFQAPPAHRGVVDRLVQALGWVARVALRQGSGRTPA